MSGIRDGRTGQDAEQNLHSSTVDMSKPRMKPDSFQADKLAWVISDKAGLRQRLLQDLGFLTIHFAHDLHSREQCQTLLNELTLQKPSLVWVRLAGPCAGSGNKLDAKRTEHLCRLIGLQCDSQRHVVVEANERSQVWNLQPMKETMLRLKDTMHQLCNYEPISNEEQPCCSRVRLLTNTDLQSRASCQCGNQKEHIHQRDMGSSGHRRFAAALRGLLKTVVVLMSQFSGRAGQVPCNTQPEFEGFNNDANSNNKSERMNSVLTTLVDTTVAEQTNVATLPKFQICLDDSLQQQHACDYWISGLDGSVIRVHTAPRTELFTPVGFQCPTSTDLLNSQRQTHMRLSDNSGKVVEHVHVDDWRSGVGQPDFGYAWTGTTMFCKKQTANTVQQHFPTEGAIRQKERKAAGHVAVPRKKIVEQHCDDCGADLSSIALLTEASISRLSAEILDDEAIFQATSAMFNNSRACMFGSGADSVPSYWSNSRVVSMEQAFFLRAQHGANDGVDVIELFGGAGHTTHLLAKHYGLRTGVNFEILAGIDLTKSSDVEFLMLYIDRNKPKVVLMGPPCIGYCKWGNLNKRINPAAWLRGRRLSVPMARLCGNVALKQISEDRHFILEQPHGSGLFEEPQWQQLREFSFRVVFDQCMVGLKMNTFPFWPVRKTTEVWASAECLLWFLQDLKCDGQHQHAHIGSWSKDGHPTVRSSDMQVWPHELCQRFAAGISECIRQMMSTKPTFFFPEGEAPEVTCPGCRGHIRKEDPRHDRGPTCRFRDVEPIIWTCEGCKHNRHRSHESHTNEDNCRWAIARTVAEGASSERAARHPRDGRVPASSDPTAVLRLEDREDGIPGEPLDERADLVRPEVLSPEEAAQRRADKASSSSVPYRKRADAETQVDAPAVPAAVSERAIVVRDEPEQRVAVPEWSKYDLGFALQQLRSIREGVVRRTLRKLHIRWFHCSSKRMMTLLEAAGVKREVLVLVPSIVDTCSVCRNWQRTGPKTVASMRVPETFNKEVQIDLLFYKTHIVFHAIDACIRWSSVALIPDRKSESILEGFCEAWLRMFGPPETVLSDQEGGVIPEDIGQWFANKGIQLVFRARNQHCAMIERHNELLRKQLHVTEDQSTTEGLRVSFRTLLAEAVFAKNALFQVGNFTPYEALFGRVPPLLAVASEETGDPLTDRDASRLRQIAINSMIQATAEQKAKIAATTKTRRAGELLELKCGDLVDFYRKPPTKDQHGWSGPAEVVNVTSVIDGIVHVKWQGRIIAVRIADLRRSMMFPVFLMRPSGPVKIFKEEIENHIGHVLRLGWLQQGQHWVKCQGNSEFSDLLSTGLYVAAVCLQLEGVVGMRVGTGITSLPAVSCDDTLLLWWTVGRISEWSHCYMSGTNHINLQRVLGSDVSQTAFAQFLMYDHDTVTQLREVVPDVAHLGGTYEPGMPKLTDKTDDVTRRYKQKMIEQDEAERTVQTNADVPTTIETSGPTIEEVQTSVSGSTVEDHLVEAPYNFKFVGLTCESSFVGATYSFDVPPVNHGCGEIPDVLSVVDDEHNNAAEFEFPPGFSHYVTFKADSHDCNEDFRNTRLVFVYEHGKTPYAVIEREHNILTREEALQHAESCKQSMVEELRRWIKHDAWFRGPKEKSVNTLKSRWVLKWKIISKDGVKQKRIKSRLVAQGFLDRQETSNFAGTTTRWGQRLLIIVSVQFGWAIWSADISEAFLRGLTFAELKEENQGVLRQVEISVPPGAEHLLRLLPGYEDFNPETEVLFLRKPGFGLKDAPRLWLLALKRVLLKLGARPTNVDPQLYTIHGGDRLQLLLSIHVDDIKITGEPEMMDKLVKGLEEHFDALKLEKGNFLHLGLQHETLDDGSVRVSQQHYVNELREIPEDKLRVMNKSDLVDDEYKKYFMSLIGGLAWCVQTRMDVAIFVGALQRRLQKPCVEDVLNLNRVLRYVKAKPLALVFKKIPMPWQVVAISDSGFKGEDQDHLAIRSGIVALVGKDFPTLGDNNLQIVEFVSKKQTRVCRSTYAAELFSCLDLAGLAMNVNMTMSEILLGNMSAGNLAALHESGKLALNLDLVIDAAAVFENLITEETKTPTDPSMLIHALKLKELLREKLISRLLWCDTRAMLADGLNKGSVLRDQLRKAAETGIWTIPYDTRIHAEPDKDAGQSASSKAQQPST